jgi:hypothetical protein
MPLYNVHIYREMRLFFPGIEAATPEEAAKSAADRPTHEASYTEDCDGENLAALIDVIGDDEFAQSVIIDFEDERLRKAAPDLLAALTMTAVRLAVLEDAEEATDADRDARATALAAIAKATYPPPQADG